MHHGRFSRRAAGNRAGLTPHTKGQATAGTGAETNAFGVVTDVQAGRKFYVGHASTLPAAPRARGAGDALDWIVRSCMRRACVANPGNANAATSAAFGGGLDRVAAQRLLSGQWTSNWPFSVKALATPEV